MRLLSLGLLCSATLLLSGCGSNDKPPDGAMTVDPQRIVSQAGSIRTLHGEFSIRPARPNEPYMAPATNGGACLLAKIPVEGKSCTKQSDCNIDVPGQPQWTGYCLGADQLPTTQGGTCWIKPSDQQYCLKRVGPGDHSTPVTDTSVVYAYVAQTSPDWNKPIDWVLLGCLNGTFPPSGPPCGTGIGPKIDRASQVRPVPQS